MARGGNLADWQQQLAARREDERLARERKRQEKEREKAQQQEHHEAGQRAAEEQTAAVREQIESLDEVLTSVLTLPPVSFDRLMVTVRTPAFDPGPLGVAQPAPDWTDFAPARPGGLRRLLTAAVGRKRQTAQARARFEAAVAEHRQRESQRQKDLAVAKAKYHGKVTEERARAAARNAHIERRRSAFGAGDAEAVEWFARCVLKASRYPDAFPRAYQVAYDPPARTVAVEFELPPRRVIPSARAYQYVPAREAADPVPRPEDEIDQRYERLITCIALRTLHEIFSATLPDVVRAVSFTGYLGGTDRATGKPVRPHLVRVSAERPRFEDLVLAEVDPAACLAGLGAQVSVPIILEYFIRTKRGISGDQNSVSRSAVSSTSISVPRASR